jgi:transcriptional regulator with XRE-family HTH domain
VDDYGRRLTLAVAEKIQALRQVQALSLDDLAERSGLHPTSIGLIVRGRRGLTLASGAALSRALGVTLGELVSDAERELGEE